MLRLYFASAALAFAMTRVVLAAAVVLAYAFALVTGLLIILMLAPAFAADSAITIPWGDWVVTLASHAGEIVLMVGLWLMRRLPGQIIAVLQMVRAEQLLEKAVDFGLNAVAGAARGRMLTVDVGSEVVAQAMQYAIDNGPSWLVSWMGGESGIRQKIIARLQLIPDASLT